MSHTTHMNYTALPTVNLVSNGKTILRVVDELREWLGSEDVPESFLEDLDKMESVGKWLLTANSIRLIELSTSGHALPRAGLS